MAEILIKHCCLYNKELSDELFDELCCARCEEIGDNLVYEVLKIGL